MTVSTMYAPIEYEGDGESVAFAVPWMFLEADDLRIYLVNPTTEAETVVPVFTATGAGNEAGGTVTVPDAPGTGLVLRIERRTDRDQEMDLTPQGRFPAVSLERAADKLTLIVQELDYQLGGSDSGGDGSASTPGIATLEAFPPKNINWLSDSAGDLWDKSDAQLAFRIDFMTKGYNFLRFFRTIFSGNNGNPSGKFAIYGGLGTKLYEDTLPDFDNYALVEFSVPIGISDYDFISVVMDAGLTGIPQPIAQSIKFIPAATALSRYAFAGTFQHEKNTVFPETCPGMLYTDIKYFLARWCAIGVQ